MPSYRVKTRLEKLMDYDNKYADIPRDYKERLGYLYDTLNLSEADKQDILNQRVMYLSNMRYKKYFLVLYENPEGKPRPKFRVNRSNVIRNSGSFVQTYSVCGKSDKEYLKKILQGSDEAAIFDGLLHYPCIANYDVYFRTPASFNKKDIMLAEMGMKRPVIKPDWDNIGKKYCDMFNDNIWEDDRLIIQGTVSKWFSVLPRVEITLYYLDTYYHRSQIDVIKKKYDNINYIKNGKICTYQEE